MDPLFLALHGQYFIFKNSNFFEFTNFPFKTKYNITVGYSVNKASIHFRKENKKKNVELTLRLNLPCID